MADGKGYLSRKIPMAAFQIGNYHARLDLYSAPLAWDAILGMDWFGAVNPTVDWTNNTVTFTCLGITHTWDCLSVRADIPKTQQQIHNLYHMQTNEIKKLLPSNGYVCHLNNDEYNAFAKNLENAIEKLSQSQQDRIKEYHELFEPYNELPPHREGIDMEIKLEEGSKPTWSGLYQMSLDELNRLKEELERLLEVGHIRKSVSAFGAPLFWVKQGEKYRLVFDFRALNKVTIKDRTALPNMRELMDRLSSCKYFSKLDLQRGFNQIRVKDEDCHKLAFRTKYGHFEWTVMPFGPTNSPSVFQSAMNGILMEYIDDFVFVYIDDILIASATEEEHIEHITKVLERLRINKFKIRPEKCSFFQNQIEYLGYIIGAGMIVVHPDRMKAITNWKLPNTEHELRSFIGLMNTIMSFVPDYGRLIGSLSKLITTRGKNSSKLVEWTEETKQNFESLRTLVPESLHMFNPHQPIHLFVDWSEEFATIGGWIGQDFNNDGKILPIAYNSQKVELTEVNLAPYNGELLSIVQHVRKFKNYLSGRKVYLYTDQKALKSLMEGKKLTHHQQRGIDTIMEYDMEIQWIPGTWNKIADYLSRKSTSSNTGTQTTLDINVINYFGRTLKDEAGAIATELLNDDKLGPIYKYVTQTLPFEKLRPWMKGEHKRFSLKDGLLWFNNDRLCIPTPTRQKALISQFHDSECSAHPGDTLLKAAISKYYYWPGMYKDIFEFVNTCDLCQRGKIRRQLAYGQSVNVPLPTRKMDQIALDFILGLNPCMDPLTKLSYDAITIFVDVFSKYVILVPGNTTDSAKDVSAQYFSHVVRHFGLAETLISDRDSRFRSGYWTELQHLLGTELRMAFAHHHESVGQVERYVAVVADAIRCVCLDQNWLPKLGTIQFSINNSKSTSTGESPFFILHGQDPRTPYNSDVLDITGIGCQTLEEMRATSQLVSEKLALAQDKQRFYHDKFKRPMSYQIGDKVLIDSSHYHFASQAVIRTKLSFPFVGPYKVVALIGETGCRLNLPASLKMSNEFPISALVPFRDGSGTRNFTQPLADMHEEYEVSRIYGHKLDKRCKDPLYRHQFLVSWTGYDQGSDSFEPLANLLETSFELLSDFLTSTPSFDECTSAYDSIATFLANGFV